MRIRWIAIAGLFFPLAAMACDWSDRHHCKDTIGQLVAYRGEAIEYAFGNVFGALPRSVEIRFVTADDAQYAKFSGRVAYDSSERMLIIPRRYVDAQTPQPLRWAASYWPYYQNRQYRTAFPLIEAIDNALWGAVLQETARARGLSWPHEECGSINLDRRLPCEMLIAGVAAYLTERKPTMFNSNRVDRIWPDNFSEFEQRVWRRNEREYTDVQHYGGILLLRPLFSEFGVPLALTYVAETPFRVEGDNLRASALRYQERARQVLEGRQTLAEYQYRPGEAAVVETTASPRDRDRRFVAFGLARDGA